MPDHNKKQPDGGSAETKRREELDEFWDVGRLLPDRPTRRMPSVNRPTPSAVELELTPREPGGEGNAVTASPLTVPREAGRYRPSVNAVGDIRLSRPDSRPAPAPNPAPNPAPTPSVTENRPAPPPTPSAVVHTVPVPPAESPAHQMPAPGGGEEPPLSVYQPDGYLLHRVEVQGWHANYHYFDQFVEDACRMAARVPEGEPRRESFFSYFPQYVQMNRRQTAWYLWWREQVRGGIYPDTDYAYVLLYLFELINLPVTDGGPLPDEEARRHSETMARVWVAYRRSYPQLDHYMCEWLCDYCLIHRLNAPVDLLAPALDAIIEGSRLKEFYLSAAVRPVAGDTEDARGTARATAHILMRHCCQYDYRKSKFAQGEHKALFDRVIPAAVASVLPLLLGGEGQRPIITMLDSTVTRDAFTGALCSYRNKRRIKVAYTSFSRSHELRFLIGDMVKHVENRLRSWIGVRSRLSVMSLPVPLREALDAYLAPMTPPKSAIPVKKREEPRPAYEALYDLPRKAVTTEDAAAIEASSWETTRILVEAFEEEPAVPPDSLPGDPSNGTSNVLPHETGNATPHDISNMPLHSASDTIPQNASNAAPLENKAVGGGAGIAVYAAFLRAALAKDAAAQRAAATALRKMPDAVADEINALTAESELGDIILEERGGVYAVIPDYREDVEAMLE